MHHIRRGTGKPLLLIHGLGGHWQSWNPIIDDLAAEREVIAVDLPGFGRTPKLAGETSMRTLADETAAIEWPIPLANAVPRACRHLGRYATALPDA